MDKRKKGQRADGLFQCKRKMPDGTTRVFYGHSKTEAEGKYLEALRMDAEKKSTAELFETAAQEYWEDFVKRIKEGTGKTYRSHWERCVKAFSGYHMDEITRQMIERFFESMKNEGLAVSTVRNARSVLNGIFRQWRMKTNSSYNPLQDTTAVGAPAVVREPPTEREIATLRAHPEGFGLCAWLLMYTGCRLGEAVALQWNDVDFERNQVHVTKSVSWAGGGINIRIPKTKNAVRDIPLLPPLKGLLESRREGPMVYVIGGMKRPLTDAEYHDRWLTYCTSIGLVTPCRGRTKYRDKRRSPRNKKPLPPVMKASVTAHQLRHSFATDLYDAGVGVLEAQKIMGHADISTTYKIYTHIRERRLEEAAGKLAAFYARGENSKSSI